MAYAKRNRTTMLITMWRNKVGMALAFAAVCHVQAVQVPSHAFSDAERAAIKSFWSEQGRYRVGGPMESQSPGPYQVRLSPEGSLWLWSYDRARGVEKVPPTQIPEPEGANQLIWEAWVGSKLIYDEWVAQQTAQNANFGGPPANAAAILPPAAPNPIPEDLAALVGSPPPFYSVVVPKRHTIDFGDGHVVTLPDHVVTRKRYAYYRFPQGVMHAGRALKNLPDAELERLFDAAGVTATQRKVFRAVSLLEGGFESVNTYDTGFVSVGFLQFACLAGGSGSLGAVLLAEKTRSPEGFESDFRRFGIDVSPAGLLIAIDLTTGAERVGPDAAQAIINDKRLAAVFHRAGTVSEPFRIAQIQVAIQRYYPADDRITVLIGGVPTSVRVGDIVTTEAGLATLMDRKVNTGRLDPMAATLQSLLAARPPQATTNLPDYEWELVSRLAYRKDYLADSTLTQPRMIVIEPSRAGSRAKRLPKIKKQ